MALKVKVLDEYCKGCEFCIHFCPKKALMLGKARNSYGAFYPTADMDKCIGCGICAIMCPDAAIEIREVANNG